jgi:hypothetical protein
MSPKIKPLKIKDCDLVAIATGLRAQNLKELRNNLLSCHPGCVYYHFWGGLIRPRFVDPEYNNDFAAWASHGIHDKKLAETLGVIDPTDFKDIEDLRNELIEIIEQRLDESEYLTWSHSDSQFNFIRSEIVVFDTKYTVNSPEDLAELISHLSVTSIFYHFIDARRRSPKREDDFRQWLLSVNGEYKELCVLISQLDPYFITLNELRAQLSNIFNSYFAKED